MFLLKSWQELEMLRHASHRELDAKGFLLVQLSRQYLLLNYNFKRPVEYTPAL
jgi:hypothetical protein